MWEKLISSDIKALKNIDATALVFRNHLLINNVT